MLQVVVQHQGEKGVCISVGGSDVCGFLGSLEVAEGPVRVASRGVGDKELSGDATEETRRGWWGGDHLYSGRVFSGRGPSHGAYIGSDRAKITFREEQ